MRILLIGGGTGGHIMPLLAVAHELKKINPSVELVGVCEKGSRFVKLYHDDKSVDRVFQVRAGKYRRYAGLPWWKKIVDVKTFLLNVRDVFRTMLGYFEAKGLLRELKPDVILIKGGFVAVPIGKAAAKLGIPYITHDSDSVPGLANRLISQDATVNATGLPVNLYSYPKNKTIYTGIPLGNNYKKVTPVLRASYRDQLGLSACSGVIAVIGGSQGAQKLNHDIVTISGRLMQRHKSLGIIMLTGKAHEKEIRQALKNELLADESKRVVVKGFVNDLHVHSGAADIIISRAGASSTAEFALQGLPLIMVPGRLAGDHQKKNADYFVKKNAAVEISYGDTEGLLKMISNLLDDANRRSSLAQNLNKIAKPDAAKELAVLTLETAKK